MATKCQIRLLVNDIGHFLWRTPIGAGSKCSPAKDPARWLQSCGKPTTCSWEPREVIVESYIYYVFWIDSFASACHNLLTLLCSGPSILSQLCPTKARQSRSLATHQMATRMFLENTQKAISKMMLTCRQQIALQPDPDWDLANNRPNLVLFPRCHVLCPEKAKI